MGWPGHDWLSQRDGALGCPDLTVELGVLPDAVLEVGDLGREPGPSAGDAGTFRQIRPPVKRG